MTRKFIIYGLIDPRDGQLRYVGKSCSGMKRPTSHWLEKRQLDRKDRCHSWVKNVLVSGHVPEIEIFQECNSKEELPDLEVFWISYFKMICCNLTNMTRGGEGGHGENSEITRRKISTALIGRPLSSSHKAILSSRKFGNKNAKGSVRSQEQRELISLRNGHRVKCLNDGLTFCSEVKTAFHYSISRTSLKRVLNGELDEWKNLIFSYV